MSSAIRDFKEFILRGNVVDLAVGIVIGVAFADLIHAFVRDFITPLVAIFGSGVDFSSYIFKIGNGTFKYGDFINFLLAFLIIAAVVFFFVVRPVNYLMSRRKTETEVEMPTRDCPHCFSSIPEKATRCAFCTSELSPAT